MRLRKTKLLARVRGAVEVWPWVVRCARVEGGRRGVEGGRVRVRVVARVKGRRRRMKRGRRVGSMID